MAILFSDNFTPDGILSGRSPAFNALPAFSGNTWEGTSSNGYDLTCVSGRATNVAPGSADGTSGVWLGQLNSPTLGSSTLVAAMQVRSGPTLTPIYPNMVQMHIHIGGKDVVLAMDWDQVSTWTLALGVGNVYADATFVPAPDTDYPVVLTLADGAQSLSFGGTVVSLAVAWTAPTYGPHKLLLEMTSGVSVGNFRMADTLADLNTPTANAALPIPPASVLSRGGGGARLALPAASADSASGALSRIKLPMLTMRAVGHDSTGERSFKGSVPRLAVVGRGGADARLAFPALRAAVAGTSTALGAAPLVLPTVGAAAAGTVAAQGAADLSMPAVAASGAAGAVGAITIGRFTVAASATTGAVGQARLTLPLFEMTASGTAQNYGGAAVLLPALQMGGTAQAWLALPGFTLSAIGTAVVTATYEAYSINLTHQPSNPAPVDEVTRYTNFPFTHIVRYQNSYFGAAADGLYLLDGTTDDGAAIPYAIKTCMDDLKAPELKTVASAFLSGRIGPDVTVSLHAGEDGAESYDFNTLLGTAVRNHREKFGRGVKNRYFALALTGTDALELDSIDLEINKMKRKV